MCAPRPAGEIQYVDLPPTRNTYQFSISMYENKIYTNIELDAKKPRVFLMLGITLKSTEKIAYS